MGCEGPLIEGTSDLLRDALEGMPDAVTVVDWRLRVRYANAAARALLVQDDSVRSTLSCSLGSSCSRACVISADDTCPLRRVLATGAPHVEHTISAPSGSGAAVNLEITVSPLLRPDRTIWGVLETARDLSGRALFDRRITTGKGEWEATVDSLVDSVVLTDQQGRIRRCNAALSREIGAPYKDLIGRHIDGVFPSPGLQALSELPGGTVDRRDGERFLRLTKNRLTTSARVQGWVYVIRDISSEVEASDRLLRERQRLGATLAAISDGVIAVDREGRIALMNRSAEALVSLKSAAAVGADLTEVYRTEFEARAAPAPFLAGAPHSGGASRRSGKVLLTMSGSTRVVAESVSPIQGFGGEPDGKVIVFRDVGDVRRLESIAASVELTNNLGQVFSSVRHEIGNPLNALKTALSVLREGIDSFSREKLLRYLDRSIDDVARIERLLEKMRALNLLQDVEPRLVDVTSLLSELSVRLREDLARRCVRFAPLLPGEALLAWADPRALEQVLLGLVTNAVEAMENSPSPWIGLECREEGDIVSIRVSDSGSGVKASDLPHVFLPLFSTKRQGTGLGLPLARSLLAHMEGTIDLSNRPGGGVRVEITLTSGDKHRAASVARLGGSVGP